MIRRGVTSIEHDAAVLLIAEKFNGEAVTIRGSSNIKGKYFPDVVTDNTDFEIEVVPRKGYIKKKFEKWDQSRKKILILSPNTYSFKIFDEVYLLKEKELIKIK